MALSRRNSSIPPRSPKVCSSFYVFFEAWQVKSSGASGSVREFSSRPRDMLGAPSRLAGFPADASSQSRETRTLAAASLEWQLRTLSSSSLIARCSSLWRRSCSARLTSLLRSKHSRARLQFRLALFFSASKPVASSERNRLWRLMAVRSP